MWYLPWRLLGLREGQPPPAQERRLPFHWGSQDAARQRLLLVPALLQMQRRRETLQWQGWALRPWAAGEMLLLALLLFLLLLLLLLLLFLLLQ